MLRLNQITAVLLFTALTIVVMVQVVARLILHVPVIWSEEVARFLFFWTVLLGAAVSVRRRRHFTLDALPRRWRERSGTVGFLLKILPDVCILGFAAFLLVPAWTYVQAGTFRTATNSRVNMALVYAAIPVFAALTVVYAILNLRADYRTFREGRAPDRRLPAAE